MEKRVIRALLIEDSEEDAQLILATLAAGGFSVVSKRVETAEQMRSALQAEDWSVVLSDFNLPSFSAIEALGILRNLGSRVPMIVVTGAIGEESAAGIIKAGATDLVTKQGLQRLVPVVERNLRELDSVRQYQAALAALDESEARFKAIAANLPGVVFQSLLYDDGSADLAYVSEGSHLVLGVTADVMMSQPEMILDMIVPEDRKSFVASRIESATQLTPRNWEGRIRVGPDRQEIKWVNLRSGVRRLSSGVVISDGIISNITDSKLAQHATEAQQQLLRQLASHIEGVKEAERAHVAREIHDDLGGTLTAAKIDLAAVSALTKRRWWKRRRQCKRSWIRPLRRLAGSHAACARWSSTMAWRRRSNGRSRNSGSAWASPAISSARARISRSTGSFPRRCSAFFRKR